MSESVSFKAYLKRPGQDAEVRRFGIDTGAAASYMYMRSKIQTVFPSIRNDNFNILWHDGDDYISVSSDEELVIALTNMTVQPIKLHIQVKASAGIEEGDNEQPQTVHPGITCDGCEESVTGFRYKCVSCPDFDLCSKCEMKGFHPEHFMLRITKPMPSYMSGRHFRKFLGRPHKFAKFHRSWDRAEGQDELFTEATPPPPRRGHCPFVNKESQRPAAPRPPKVADMFDFSALMDFINGLGVVLNERPTTGGGAPEQGSSSQAEASTQAQASTTQASTSQASTSQTQASTSQARPATAQPSGASNRRQDQNNEYLNQIGQVISAVLDPFGVDVAFDVRPRTSASTTTGAPTAGESTPAGFNNNNNNNQASPPVAPTTVTSSPTASGTASPAVAPTMANPNSAIPLPGPTPFASASQNVWGGMSRENSPPNEARRNSTDGWTLLNRESPTRGEAMAVDVEEVLGARPKTVYPQLPKETPAAASTLPSAPVNPQNQKIQEAIEKIRSMGFNFDPILVKDLLQNQNCDIVTVLEMLLGNTEKK